MNNPSESRGDSAAGRPRLGELLVQRGLLAQDRLDAALAEQQATGLPLGTILVRDGLVPTHAVAMALADQTGAPLKTEHGYAVGHRTSTPAGADVVPLRPPPTSDNMPGESLLMPTVIGEPVVERIIEHGVLRTPDQAPPPGPPPAPAPAAAPAPPPIPVDDGSTYGRLRAPDQTPAPAPPSVPVDDGSAERLAALEARAEELSAALAAASDVIDVERAAAAELRMRLDELEARFDAQQAELPLPQLTERVYSAERHVLIAPNGERYELFERKGPAPAVGSIVQLSGHRDFRVLRVGPAPFPGALEACAFLDPVQPPPTAED